MEFRPHDGGGGRKERSRDNLTPRAKSKQGLAGSELGKLTAAEGLGEGEREVVVEEGRRKCGERSPMEA